MFCGFERENVLQPKSHLAISLIFGFVVAVCATFPISRISWYSRASGGGAGRNSTKRRNSKAFSNMSSLEYPVRVMDTS